MHYFEYCYKFPDPKTLHAHEIRVKATYPRVNYHILEIILSKEIQ